MRPSKMFLTALSIVLILSVTGCSPLQEQPGRTTALTALQYEVENQSIDFENLWFYKEIEKKTGVHVHFEVVKDADWLTRQSLMFASNHFTDMVLRGSLNTEDYGVRQHLLIPLDDYLNAETMPHYTARTANTSAIRTLSSSDGHTYKLGFLISQNINTNGHFFINQNWLDKLGLKVPSTVDELTDVLRAFRDGDPNGNGLKDEIPYQATFDDNNTGIYNAFSAWGIPMNEEFVYIGDDGRIYFAPLADDFRAAVEWLHLLYTEHLLDMECLTQGSNIWGAKMNQGTAGYFSYWRLSNTALTSDVARQYTCILPVAAAGSRAVLSSKIDSIDFGASLTSQNHDVKASLRWLDAQFETETMLVSQNGQMGDTLIKDEDGRYAVAYVPADNELLKTVPIICGQFFAASPYYESVYKPAPHREEKVDFCRQYAEADVLEHNSYCIIVEQAPKTCEESARLLQLHTELKNTIDSALVSFITLGVDDEGYSTFRDTLLEEGAMEYAALYQQIYDRWLEEEDAL